MEYLCQSIGLGVLSEGRILMFKASWDIEHSERISISVCLLIAFFSILNGKEASVHFHQRNPYFSPIP
jgi:hypothetical protein